MSKKIPLKDLCIEDEWGKYGIPASAEEYASDKTRYLRITDISEDGELLNNDKKSVSAPDIEKYLLQEGDIVFARTGNSTGKSYYHEEKNGKLAFAGFLIKYSLDKTKVNPKYVKFFTITNEYKNWVKNLSVGSTRGNINAQTFGDCPISVPERKQQELLVRTLSLIIDKIELNNRINAELEAMAKTLYDYWFVQFDFPTPSPSGRAGVGLPYKTSGGKMVWNVELNREVPEGWEVKKIGKILKTSLGGTPSTKVKEYWENGKISWLNSGEIANFPIIDSELKITEAAIKNSATNLLPKGSVMLSITRHLRPSILGIDACANQSVLGILENGDIKCYFLYPYLQNEIPRLMEMRSGAQQPHINKEIVDMSLILIPNNQTDILKKYNAVVGHFYDSIINKAFQNQKLTELRDWLLPMLMNGQVKVKDEKETELSMAAEPKIKYGK